MNTLLYAKARLRGLDYLRSQLLVGPVVEGIRGPLVALTPALLLDSLKEVKIRMRRNRLGIYAHRSSGEAWMIQEVTSVSCGFCGACS